MNQTYVFVRTDLKPVQIAVQAAHAAALVGCSGNLIILRANSEEQLMNFAKKIKNNGFDIEFFIEPDYNDSVTAFALRTDDEGKKKLSNFGLLRESDLCPAQLEDKKVRVTNTLVADL